MTVSIEGHSVEELTKAFHSWEAKKVFYERVGYKPGHEEIIRFHQSQAKVKVARAPSRSGKSYSAAYDMLPTCLIPDTRSWIVGQSYHLAEKEFRVIHDALVINRDRMGLPKPTICNYNVRSGSLYIKWPWNSYLECKSAENPESLLGEAINHVIYSEAAQLPRKIRERYVMQRLGTTGGKELVPTTPAQAAEWVKELDELGHSGKYDWIQSFHWPVTANPAFNREEMDRAIEIYGIDHPMIREQYFGEWTNYGGRVYPTFQPETHVIDPFPIPISWERYRGIDFGLRDPFVCLWVAQAPNGTLYLYREYYCRDGISTHEHAQEIKARTGDEHIRLTVGDPTSAQLIADLNYEGIPVIKGNNDRAAGRARVMEYLAMTPDGAPPHHNGLIESDRYPRLYVFNTCPETIREFMNYSWREGKRVEGEKERTEGDDHSMDTLRYIIIERPSPRRSKSKSVPGTFNWYMKKAANRNRTGGLVAGYGDK